MELLFVTHNAHKVKEIESKLGNLFRIKSMTDFGLNDDIEESGSTLEENAQIKARYVQEKLGMDCFADDTGLEVEVLNGRPGVYSARFAGPDCIAENNITKLLNELKNQDNRSAQFRTVICLIIEGKEYLFEGKIKGKIVENKAGVDGFGYDPIFQPNGYSKTFAEMSLEEKNTISHRALALNQLVEFFEAKAS
jgi:XTP/dITP diphosphohydrolase